MRFAQLVANLAVLKALTKLPDAPKRCGPVIGKIIKPDVVKL